MLFRQPDAILSPFRQIAIWDRGMDIQVATVQNARRPEGWVSGLYQQS